MNSPLRKKSFTSHKSHSRREKINFGFFSFGWLKKILSLRFLLKIFGILIILSIFSVSGIVFSFMRGIPDIGLIEREEFFYENTVIYDKDKNPLYTLYSDGKRTYVDYSEISDSIKNAIISTEDKTFFENPGIDIKGLIRAGYNYVSGKTARIQGTSTLSQQLISITLLSKERSIKRKVQEAYLSYELNNNYSKEKILEMYLNTLSFGNNSNGIEEASKTYFGKSAKDVGSLGATILASLPKGPTYYSPYSHRDRLMGEVYVYPLDDPEDTTSLFKVENRKEFNSMYDTFKKYLSGITIENNGGDITICGINKEYIRDSSYIPDSEGCSEKTFDDILNFLGDIIIRDEVSQSGATREYALEYLVGRKDFVGLRMFEDGKIDGDAFMKIIFDGLEFEFKKYTEKIQHPYFVMYIKEYLEGKYGNDIDINTGLKVYTTLDPKLQAKAEELVKNQSLINKKQFGATSAALISMDNVRGALLSMVGGPDYFDIENGGNNNMTTSLRQPGSSFKPFVYGLAISKNPIGPESPVADAKTSFGPWTPDNYDKGFKGVMTLKDALNYSRNIPAIKMFYLAGKEEAIIKFGRIIGFTSFKDNVGYGAPMAIGTAEVRPIDLMQAYSVFANLGVKQELYAIERIEDSDGNILEEHKVEAQDPVFSPAASYIVNTMLSDVSSRPEGFWRNALTVAGGRLVAVKTGTSNKDVSEGGEKKILPRDLWTAGYTPQITTVVWAGNVDGKETKGSCDGLNCAAPIWKGFMEFAHKDLPKLEWKRPEGVFDFSIVKASGRLATSSTPEDQKISTIMAVKLTEVDGGFKEEFIDTLCNGPLSENTPEGARGKILVPASDPIIDGYDPSWKKGFFGIAGSGSRTQEPCERPGGPGNITLAIRAIDVGGDASLSGKKIIEGSWNGDRTIKKVTITIDDEIKLEKVLDGDGKLTGSERINTTINSQESTITFSIVDTFGFTYKETRNIGLGDVDIVSPSNTGTVEIPKAPNLTPIPGSNASAPVINLINPKGSNVNLYSGDPLNIRFSIDMVPGAREITVSIANRIIFTANEGNSFVIPFKATEFNEGSYQVGISIIDSNLKKAEKSFTITILPR